MEWLQKILENEKKKNIPLDIETVIRAVKKEFPLHAVPKASYNETAGKLKAARQKLQELDYLREENAALHRTVRAHEEKISQLRTQIWRLTRDHTLKMKLSKLGVIDPAYLIYRMGGVEGFTFDENGEPIGLLDLLEPMHKEMPYLFYDEMS